MTDASVASAIIAGFADDLALVVSELPAGVRYAKIDENTAPGAEVLQADVVVYVFSADTGYSSQLLGRFTSIHHHARAREEYLLGVGDVKLPEEAFPFARQFEVISMKELRKRLRP